MAVGRVVGDHVGRPTRHRHRRGEGRALPARRGAVEPTDWHELEKERFTKRVASALEQLVRAERIKAIVIVAPPRTLWAGKMPSPSRL